MKKKRLEGNLPRRAQQSSSKESTAEPDEYQCYALRDRTPVLVTLPEYLAWQRDPQNRVVAKNWVQWVEVSTIFLGATIGTRSNPKNFETIVFGGKLDQQTRRYATWDEAAAGHWAMVQQVSGTIRIPIEWFAIPFVFWLLALEVRAL